MANDYISNKQIVKDILCDVTYASAYWATSIRTDIPTNELTGDSREAKWFDCVDKGGHLIVTTIDPVFNDDNDKGKQVFYISYKDLSKATSTVRKFQRYKDINYWDELFADAILQIACFNEIIYD